MNQFVLPGLVKRRARIAGEVAVLQERVAKLQEDMLHLDAVIEQYDPGFDTTGIRPSRPRPPSTPRGDVTRFVLTVLRDAGEPMTTAAVRQQWMVANGLDQGNKAAVRRAARIVRRGLERQARKGTIRGALGTGRFVVWELA